MVLRLKQPRKSRLAAEVYVKLFFFVSRFKNTLENVTNLLDTGCDQGTGGAPLKGCFGQF